jgi:hypothetical protein
MEKENVQLYTSIGEFVSKVNNFEFLINSMLELIITSVAEVSKNEDILNETIDFIQEQSIRIRINHIILLLSMNDNQSLEVLNCIEYLKEFSKFYNKHIRNIRDFVAHNPLIQGDISKVISSRRYKGKLNSITVEGIEKETQALGPKLDGLFENLKIISKYYKAEIVRELNKQLPITASKQ